MENQEYIGKVVSITGHRPDEFGGYEDNVIHSLVKESLAAAFHMVKPTKVIVGMALGVDQWAAEVCIKLGIPFEAAIPFLGQESIWPAPSKERYFELLAKAESKTIVCEGAYAPWKMQKRNEYMVNNSQLLVAVFDDTKEKGGTYNCVEYAKKAGKSILVIDPKLFQVK